MIKDIEIKTKALTKLLNQKQIKELEASKIQEELTTMDKEIFEIENNIMDLIKEHQKDLTNPSTNKKKKIEIKKEVE